MKKLKKILFRMMPFILCLLLFFSFSGKARADFGDYNDYDSGGSSWDSGDSGSSWGWGSSDYYYSDSDSSGEDLSVEDIIYLIVFIAIAIFFFNRKKKNQNGGVFSSGSHGGTNASSLVIQHDDSFDASVFPNRDREIEKLLQQTDPNYSTADFIAYVKDIFMDVQDAWSKRDLESVRAVLNENLFSQTQKQIDRKKADGIINAIESVAVGNCYASYAERDDTSETITVYLVAKMIDYQYKEDTGEVIRGNKTTRWENAYRLRLTRSRGALTGDPHAVQQHTCPNCGAPLETGASVVCPYCGTVVTTTRNNFVLTELQNVQRSMKDEGIRWN